MNRDPSKRPGTDMNRGGFVTRITRELYRNLTREAKPEIAPAAHGRRILDCEPEAGRWNWLQDVMQQCIEQARAEASEHREIAREQIFVVEKIELAPDGDETRQRLERFMREFSAEARVGWIKRIWPGHARDGIKLDVLRDVRLSPTQNPEKAASEEGDDFDRALRAKATSDAAGDVAIRFLGTWQQGQRVSSPPVPLPDGEAPVGEAPVHATVLIQDAEGQRAVEMREPDLTLGSAGDIPVHGKYVSRRHLRVFIEDGRLWVEDAGSTNGIWIGDVRLPAHERREVRDNAEFRLGAPSHALNLTERECPRVVVTPIVASVAVPGVTPVLGGAGALTPVLGSQHDAAETRAPLLRLTLSAAGWQREVPVAHLPFTIGRSRACDACLPEDSKAVSGCHLRLLELSDPNGVWVEDAGSTRGTYLGAERRAGRFLLPFGQPLMLGGSNLNDRHQPVELVARQATDKEGT